MNARHVLAEIAAARFVALREAAEERAQYVRDRLFELLINPSQRNAAIVEWFVDASYDRMAADIGQQAADAYYGRVMQYLRLSVEDLHGVEISDRDSAFYEAESIMLAAAKRQAYIEAGTAIDDVATGIDEGRDRKRVTSNMTPAQIRSMNYDVKGAIKELSR
jgi:hypothetical protein